MLVGTLIHRRKLDPEIGIGLDVERPVFRSKLFARLDVLYSQFFSVKV
jgi:hypothetical protein